jgi:hypothetical protein
LQLRNRSPTRQANAATPQARAGRSPNWIKVELGSIPPSAVGASAHYSGQAGTISTVLRRFGGGALSTPRRQRGPWLSRTADSYGAGVSFHRSCRSSRIYQATGCPGSRAQRCQCQSKPSSEPVRAVMLNPATAMPATRATTTIFASRNPRCRSSDSRKPPAEVPMSLNLAAANQCRNRLGAE